MGFGQYSAQGQQRRSKRQMLAEFVAEPGNPIIESKMIARNTMRVKTESGQESVSLHDTTVYLRLPDGTVKLDTGGWNTLTTRARMNDALAGSGRSVFTSKGKIFLKTGAQDFSPFVNGAFEFAQRCTIMPDGKVISDIAQQQGRSYDSVRKLVDRYINALKRFGVPTSPGGDPFVWPDPETGKYAPEEVLLWLDDPDTHEPYIFATFIYNAFKFGGFSDSNIAYWITEFNRSDRSRQTVVCRRVRRYIRACLGYAT